MNMVSDKVTQISRDFIMYAAAIGLSMYVFASPALAANNNNTTGNGSNFICGGGNSALSGAIEGLLTVIVVAAALVAVVGGALFTLASAARPGNVEEYAGNRNDAILYGLGTLVILYGAEAIVGQISPELSYDCVLPFA